MSERSGIMTVEGVFFDYDDMEASAKLITIRSIAVALSNACRYVGQIEEFYSVAQHSVAVSYLVPQEEALAALLHDAPEAVLHDVNSPLKRRLPEYLELERRAEQALFPRFGVPVEISPAIHHADKVMLATETRDLRPANARKHDVEPRPERVVPLSPREARAFFMLRYLSLGGGRK
jgi:hypothetical protein